jgi:adenylate cyclase
MTSGLVMLGYVCMHLANHILGIVSLPLAEAGLRVSMWVWHSMPGTLALYGAFVVHFSLALRTIYQRRHWQLPATEWIRLWSGFSLPLLLIGHAVSTRVAASFYGFEPSYEKIISGLIAGGSQGWQIALLAPGWVHGCLGLWIALRHYPAMQRIRPVLIGVLITVPLLSAVGFLRMSVDVEAREATVSAHASEQKRRAAPLAQWRHMLLTIYLLTVAGAFAAGRWRARYIPE